MGKSKNKKFKRPQFSAEGLPVSALNHFQDEEEVDSPAGELLEKVGSEKIMTDVCIPVQFMFLNVISCMSRMFFLSFQS